MVSEERDLMDTLYATLEICDNLALSITQCPTGCDAELSDALSMHFQSQRVHFSVLSPVVIASICGYKASKDHRNDVECLGCDSYCSMCYVSRPLGVQLWRYHLDRAGIPLAASQIPCTSTRSFY